LQVLLEYEKAPAVTRERLYLETLEEILAKSTKVLIDTEGGSNLLYLPLDQLMQRRGAVPSSEPTTVTPVPMTNNITQRSREREAR
jgi:modulator of FtsH protease HflK